MRIEFCVDEAWIKANDTDVAGCVYVGDVALGDVFTILYYRPPQSEAVKDNSDVDFPSTHAVSLRIDGIEAYSQPLDFLSRGVTGTLKLSGVGQELLRLVKPEVRNVTWLLTGE